MQAVACSSQSECMLGSSVDDVENCACDFGFMQYLVKEDLT